MLLDIYNHDAIWITICKKCEKVKDFSVNTHINVKLTKPDYFVSFLNVLFLLLKTRYKARDIIYMFNILSSMFPIIQRLLNTLVIEATNFGTSSFFL